TGDPGLIFLSAINERNPTPRLGEIQSTNPCGEVPLLPYEPCNLGSINLSRFIHKSGGSYRFHWDALGLAVDDAVRFLDDVIDVNHYIISPIREMALGNRKIGLGVMGWADSLISMGIPYASDEALALGAELMRFIAERAHQASAELAAERGVFPNWKNSVYAPALPMRNATCTSIAPTGTISIIAGASSSIEPLFALAFRRMHVLHEDVLDSVSPGFLEYLKDHMYMDKPWLQEVLSAGDLSGSTDVPEAMRLLFQTSTEINPDWHLRHQLVFQKHTDNAVSKTINLPHSASITDVDHIYRMAWKERAKGITIFRDGSTGSQVLHKGVREQADACRVCVR
ncbi:MAG TPA: ribonucleoside-diphosphate reductase, adenosylcobalamin-dependent, partial [Chitinophagaceae bacterium]|nr:ribonucleoside-diphosphate reductase, adenosylcobalamin-dependent [Chitinophagaceae bacterium]